MLPLSLLNVAAETSTPLLVELKGGDTYNGRLVSCDSWMNMNLTDVVCTSKHGDKFWKLPSCYIRGSAIKYLRLPPDLLDATREKVEEDERRNKIMREQNYAVEVEEEDAVVEAEEEGDEAVAVAVADEAEEDEATTGITAGEEVTSKTTIKAAEKQTKRNRKVIITMENRKHTTRFSVLITIVACVRHLLYMYFGLAALGDAVLATIVGLAAENPQRQDICYQFSRVTNLFSMCFGEKPAFD
eukprot:CAMPEP_0201191882 /NCGR_PEP_ID=MMETSP0851-20130426/143403_1 /ASSEMBLY_ACC=CAM_ASM_000631 /TAXON_ID=183588 /ORGANISM="Pseudo-nitzschia fraudulenta, Strain WWA7" /LENGTH=242 /DNA_ID=CAMNT_0047478087 /DNA_START=158 /DNA_END=885 /DNA_ORIENTATION=+